MAQLLTKKSKVLIADFSVWANGKRTSINGNIEALLSFFSPKVARVDLIDGPHPGSDRVISRFEIYKNEKLQRIYQSKTSFLLYPFLKLTNNSKTQISFKIRDFLSTLEQGISSGQKYQLFIGLESIYTLAGLVLKKLGIIKTVVYYVSDYAPSRYPEKWFNDVYLWLDRFCCQHADFIWDVSKAMHPARIKAGLDAQKSAPEIHVPNALFPKQINYLPLKSLNDKIILFSGSLGLENGPDLAIKAFPIIKKAVPKTELHFTGGNIPSDEERLRKLVRKMKLEKSVLFHGFIQDVDEFLRLTRSAYIGLAPYVDIPRSHRKYADSIKIRAYLASGLPIVTTYVPPLGKEAVAAGAGLITRDKPQEFARAVIKLLKDKKLYQKTRQAAIRYIKNNTWENTFTNALREMGFI